jgi:hypothetical protein
VDISLPMGGPLWFPGLADVLVRDFEAEWGLGRLGQARYGTERWLAGSSESPLFELGSFRLGRSCTLVERLTGSTAAQFETLTFVNVLSKFDLETLQNGADALSFVNGLAESVGLLVKVLHTLKAPVEYDISHSQPDLPFSAFISVPQPAERSASIRVAESLLHESMHLQLTLIDLIEPLALDSGRLGYSPWKRESRPIIGLLHGLYVFAVIHEVLGTLMGQSDQWRSYCEDRRRTIRGEVVSLPEDMAGLSPKGAVIWRRCRSSVAFRDGDTATG